LHNADEIERLDVREGDLVVVEKAGKIIPKVVRVEKHERKRELPKWKFPVNCPECDAELVRDEGGVYIRCPNPKCPAQLRQRLTYFGSRPGMDIDGLGEEMVDLLIGRHVVSGYADLYRLTVDQVADLNWLKQRKGKDGQLIEVQVGQKNAQSLIKGINASRGRGLARLLSSISIRHVGPRVAQLITREYPTVQQLSAASVEDLASIHEIGEAIGMSVHQYCQSEFGRRTFAELAEVGVDLSEPLSSSADDKSLTGKTFVVTGTLQQFKRDEIKRLIAELGGRASSSVSKKTDYLVAGDNAGSKLTKARDLGVRILSEDQFRELIGLED
jgi:DNA ligase (NAD+)